MPDQGHRVLPGGGQPASRGCRPHRHGLELPQISLAHGPELRARPTSSIAGANGGPTTSMRESTSIFSAAEALLEYHPEPCPREDRPRACGRPGCKGRIPPIEFVTHHVAHAYSAYYPSPFDRAGVLTIDGSGEDICTQIAIGQGDDLRVIESMQIPNSLGWLYAAFTQYLGFLPYRDEGKVMGLAALGEERRACQQVAGTAVTHPSDRGRLLHRGPALHEVRRPLSWRSLHRRAGAAHHVGRSHRRARGLRREGAPRRPHHQQIPSRTLTSISPGPSRSCWSGRRSCWPGSSCAITGWRTSASRAAWA